MEQIELDLPPHDEETKTYLLYGVDKQLANYCGLESIPEFTKGHWAHGWAPKYKQTYKSNLVFLGEDKPEMNPHIWVARKDEEEYLKQLGFNNAKAIGLPIIYYSDTIFDVKRVPNSLVVFPAHSLEWTTHSWKEKEYVDDIVKLKPYFKYIYACVHSDCFKSGYWVNSFRDAGIPLIKGASIKDKNSLSRVSYILSKFEYLTTNAISSSLVYGAALGTKVSVYGQSAVYKEEDFKNDPLYNKKDVLYDLLDSSLEESFRKYYSNLFIHPSEAKEMIEWGRFEIGYDNKLSPKEIIELFGWTGFEQSKYKIKKSIKRLLPNLISSINDIKSSKRIGS